MIETALALGIVAFALVPIVGLLPIGLQVSRNASDLTISAQIVQRLTGMIQQTDFSKYTNGGTGDGQLTTTFYFDGEGQPISSAATTGGQANSVYSAAILLPPASTVPTDPTSPTASQVNGKTVYNFLIRIVNDPAHQLQGTPSTTLPTNLQSHAIIIPVYLADNGS